MQNDMIKIIEKPESYSWDLIRDCLWDSHSVNRENGIFVESVHKTSEKLDFIFGNNNNKFFVAITQEEKIIGCCAVHEKKTKWLHHYGRTAELCFVGIRPQYAGKGIFSQMLVECQNFCKKVGIKVLFLNTTYNNISMQKSAQKNGFSFVDYDIFDNSPYYYVRLAQFYVKVNKFLLHIRYWLRKLYIKIRYKPNAKKRLF